MNFINLCFLMTMWKFLWKSREQIIEFNIEMMDFTV